VAQSGYFALGDPAGLVDFILAEHLAPAAVGPLGVGGPRAGRRRFVG
jgi:hypothetical protein